MKFKTLVKSFCENGSHSCSSYGISIFHSKYSQLGESVNGTNFWLVHGPKLLTQAAFRGCLSGQWDLLS